MCLIRILLVEGRQFHSILGQAAAERLRLIKMIDNDALHCPPEAEIYTAKRERKEDLSVQENNAVRLQNPSESAKNVPSKER